MKISNDRRLNCGSGYALFSVISRGDVALYGLVQGVLLVIQSERVRWPVAKRFVTDLERSGANLLGAVMNRRRQHIPGWLYRTL